MKRNQRFITRLTEEGKHADNFDIKVSGVKDFSKIKVVLMAAGRGTRISKYIGDKPKSLVDIGESSLISHTIDMLNSNGITDISVIVGYKHEMLEDELSGKNVKVYYNPDFAETNSIYSLYLAREELQGQDIIMANADVFWETDILELLLSDKREIVMLSDVERVDSGDYFFNTDDESRITDYGKTLTRENRTCEYVGIAKVDKSFVNAFRTRLIEMIEAGDVNKWWENVLYSFVGTKDVCSLDVDGRFWAEVDVIDDYKRILDYLESAKKC